MPQINNINVSVLNGLIIGRVEPQIYAFSTQTVPNYLKVGDTYRTLEIRLNEWRKYFPNLEKQFVDFAKADSETFFRDFAVHYFLENELHKNRLKSDTFADLPYFSNEFFENTGVQDVKEAIEDIKDSHSKNGGKYQFYKFDESRIPLTHTYSRTENYEPRPNQCETIFNFKKAIEKGRTNLLMYAVMRFGKSFTSMCCAIEMKAKIVVIVSAKADVKEEWKKTVESHTRFVGYDFLDSNTLLQSETVVSERLSENKRAVIFLTLQDLQGDEIKNKHKEVFENQIDLLIVDETHFGARSGEYGKVLQELSAKEQKSESKQNDNTLDELETIIKVLNANVRLHLSGTPYRILMGNEFAYDDIIAFYQFSDIAEDQEKWNAENLNKDDVKEWDNPYYGFPQMVRFAFNPNASSRKKMEELKQNSVTYAFSALFKPKSITKDTTINQNHKKFEHEPEILDLLEVIDGAKNDENLLGFLDYDKIKDGKMCRHIVCVLPYRASCNALENLIIRNKSKFKNLNKYEIINIAGIDNERLYKDTQAIKTKIKSCEAENKKTMTLTVNRMLTGSTVEEWDTMLYFKDTASPQEYDQAVFRLQNQHIKTYISDNGDVIRYNMKPQTLLVDFDPNRMFRMQEQKSQIYNVNTDKNGNTKLEERIKRELEISPIVVLNNNKIVQVVPADVLDAVRKYSRDKSVLDEATAIPVDFSLLTNEQIRAEIEKQGKIGSKQGLEVAPTEGEGEDLDVPNENTEPEPTAEEPTNTTTPVSETEENDFKGKFAMYYAKILFFAFLTDCEIKSLQETINQINTSENNKRIATSLDLNKDILALLQTTINPFILSKLDYKIQNINTLANDKSLQPIDRASNAMKKFIRLSVSEVVTPEKVSDSIVNIFPDGSIISSTKLLDIASKQGEFVYAVYKKFGKQVADNFYSIPTSKIAYEFTRKVYELLNLDMTHIVNGYTTYDLIKEDSKIIENNKIKIGDTDMNFDIILGNPPYQEMGGSGGNNDAPIYQLFVKKAEQLKPDYMSLIIPARWFAAGRENLLGDFRKEMLENKHLKKMVVYPDASELFDNVEIKGGVCYFLLNSHTYTDCEYTLVKKGVEETERRQLDAFDILIRETKLSKIVEKVEAARKKDKINSVESIISADTPFGISSNPRTSKKTPFSVYKTNNSEHNTLLYHIENQKRKIEYCKREDITKNGQDIDRFKVFITGTGGSGNDDIVLAQPEFAPENSVCSQSYLYAAFDTELEAKNFIKYLKTKFFRILVSAMKITQSAPRRVYRFVPLQDFNEEWTDEKLYDKYNLSQEERNFINNKIRTME
jgi:hypothetical protein